MSRSRSRSPRKAQKEVVSYWRGSREGTRGSSSLAAWFQAAFLPEGFPHSCSDDYLTYQLYDTVQAMASTLVGHMATAGLLKASGVGDAEANALSSAIVWMLSDGVGNVARVFFAWYNASSLDSYSKQFRLVADVANDLVLLLSLLAGSMLRGYFALVLCLSAVLRAVVSVAGAATRAAVVVHQSRGGNTSDCAAKDGSQETAVPFVSQSSSLTYGTYALLTTLHLWANYRAVHSLNFRILNPFRFDLLIERYQVSSGQAVDSVRNCNALEPILPLALAQHLRRCPPLKLGARYNSALRVVNKQALFILYDRVAVLHCDATNRDAMRAYFALRTKSYSEAEFERFVALATEAGWNLDRSALNVDEWRATW